MNSHGWAIWCRETAANFRQGASVTKGRRSHHLHDLADHYEAQACDPSDAMAGNRPSIRQEKTARLPAATDAEQVSSAKTVGGRK
jgi:hypothetical protein